MRLELFIATSEETPMAADNYEEVADLTLADEDRERLLAKQNDPRPVMPPRIGRVVAFPQVSGLHHRYERLAA
jgi:hypothetical protein